MADTIAADHPEAVSRAKAALDAGGVIVVPTETVYGLAVMPHDPDAVARMFAIKQRPATRNLPVMVAERSQLDGLDVIVPEAADRLIASGLVPGPLTIALGFGDGARPAWLEGRDEMAFRIPDNAFMLALLRETGPLFVTSANMHARDTQQTIAEILPQLAFAPDLAVDGGTGKMVPSTLVNCAVDPPKVEREGVVPRDRIKELLA
ncbi:MAG: threonylcarbamoyl-AMP synthase [Rhodospirillales bacterium]|nr:threonylcarbamoyl-AMP synthase [Rhodospirillales bacterium]